MTSPPPPPPPPGHDDASASPAGSGDGPKPLSTGSLVGHVALGVVVLGGLTLWLPSVGLAAYLAIGAVTVPYDHVNALQPRRANRWWLRVGWSLLLPFLAVGLVIQGLADLFMFW